MREYTVESRAGWFVVRARSALMAKKVGVIEHGRGQTTDVRHSTPKEIAEYIALKGEIETID